MGVGALIRSVTTNIKDTTRDVVFHVLYPTETGKPAIDKTLNCVDMRLGKHHTIEFVQFSPSIIRQPIIVHTDASIAGNLASPANFARFYLHELLPNVNRTIFLEADVIVQGDISALWDVQINYNRGNFLAAVPRDAVKLEYYFDEQVGALFLQRYGRHMDMRAGTFNTGVFVIDLAAWARMNLVGEVEHWMQQNAGEGLFVN